MNDTRTNVLDDFDQLIAAFEAARYERSEIDVSDFFPNSKHPRRAEIIKELVCIDIEWNWTEKGTKRLEEYRKLVPDLFNDGDFLKEIAFEEYRQRCIAYELVTREEYTQKYSIDTSDWPSPPSLNDESEHAGASQTVISEIESANATDSKDGAGQTKQFVVKVVEQLPLTPPPAEKSAGFDHSHRSATSSNPNASQPKAKTEVEQRPNVGQRFQHFELIDRLGEGAFAQVFLAKQDALAGRRVVLKIAKRLLGEPEKLAQLQHTNIVPVYSVHQQGIWHAICMPFVGRVTLAHVIERIESLGSLNTKANNILTIVDQLHSATQNEDIESKSLVHVSQADVQQARERIGNFSYIDSTLWIIAQLADGLAHAHERGLLHRDIKPANILLSDDGQPMLLDFNVATALDNTDAPSAGTLRYMSPQLLHSLQTGEKKLDVRNDIYSLGLVLFELLTGRFPWPFAKVPGMGMGEVLLNQRRESTPDIRTFNPCITPAVAAIVRGMLEPDANKRYSNARQIKEDIEAHLANRSLVHRHEPLSPERVKKWVRRNPKLAGALAVGLFAVIPIAVPAVVAVRHHQQVQTLESVQKFENTREVAREIEYRLTARLDESTHRAKGLELGHDLLNRYSVLESDDWQKRSDVRRLSPAQQQELQNEIGQVLLLLSRAEERNESYTSALSLNESATKLFGAEAPVGLWQQRVRILENMGRLNDALPYKDKITGEDFTDLGKLNTINDLISQGKHKEAIPLCEALTRKNPSFYQVWFALGHCQYHLGRMPESVASYSVCVALQPDSAWANYNRGILYTRLERWVEAIEDLNRVLKLKPDLHEAKINRAIAYRGVGKHREAESDLTEVIAVEKSSRAYFLRADVRRLLKEEQGSKEDMQTALKVTPTDEQGWIDRGLAHLETDAKTALSDFEAALKINPRSRDGLQNKVHVLGEKFNQTKEAIQTLNQLIEWYPDFLPSHGARGVYHARLGNRKEARRDAEHCLKFDRSPFGLYQQASLYALLSKHDNEATNDALKLFEKALQAGFNDFALIEADTDIDPVRKHPTFVKLLALAKELHKANEKK